MGEASGPRSDSTINSNTLTDNNSVTQANGRAGQAGQFTRVFNEYLSRAETASLNVDDADDFEASALVYLDSSTALYGIMGQYGTDNANQTWTLSWIANLDHFSFQMTSTTGENTLKACDEANGYTTGTWYYVVAYWDASANTMGIQCDADGYERANSNELNDGSYSFDIGRSYGSSSLAWARALKSSTEVPAERAIIT